MGAWRRVPVLADLPPADLLDNRQYRTVVLLTAIFASAARGVALLPNELVLWAESAQVANPRLRAARCQFAVEICALTGDTVAAMGYLRDALAADLQDFAWIEHCPTLEPLRHGAQWAAMRKTMAERAQRVAEAVFEVS